MRRGLGCDKEMRVNVDDEVRVSLVERLEGGRENGHAEDRAWNEQVEFADEVVWEVVWRDTGGEGNHRDNRSMWRCCSPLRL